MKVLTLYIDSMKMFTCNISMTEMFPISVLSHMESSITCIIEMWLM